MALPCGFRLALFCCALAVLCASQAFPHGDDHGAATAPEGGVSLVSVHGYQVELLTKPSPVRSGAEARIIAKIQREDLLMPVRDGRVFIKMAPSGTEGGLFPPPQDLSSYTLASEETWAGNYTAKLTPAREGPHRVTIAIAELGGTSFDPPAVVNFALKIAPPAGMNGSFLTLAVVAVAMAGVGVWTFAVRARYGTKDPNLNGTKDPNINLLDIRWVNGTKAPRLNWLDIPWVKKLLLSRFLQPSLQIPLLIFLVVLVIVGFKDIQDGGKNLATKLVWTLWWPGVIFTFIIVGRLWCFMCPFGALTEWASKLVKPNRQLPRAFRNLWLATGMFVLLTLADEQLGVVRSPQITAWLLILFALVSLGIGLFYLRRSFCRYLCPIGGMIGIYSMFAPLELRAKSKAVCRTDATKACYKGNTTESGCPMFEFPMAMDRNMSCNLCFQCVRACPKGNLTLRLRPFGQDLWATSKRSLDESYFAIALVGITTIVTAQMLTDWQPFISWLAKFLGPLRSWMRPMTYLTLTESAVFLIGSLVLFPLLLWMAARLADRGGRRDAKGKRTFVLFGYIFVPIGLAMHLAHNLSHLFMEGPGIIPAFQRFINSFTPFSLGDPVWDTTPLLDVAVIHWLQIVLPLVLFAFFIKAAHRLVCKFYGDDVTGWRTLAPMVALALVFTVLNVYLLSLPMGMRHGM